MPTGTIKTLSDRGYGFIQVEGSPDNLFFHVSGLQGTSFQQLHEGQAVEFDVQPDQRTPTRQQAVNVRLVSTT